MASSAPVLEVRPTEAELAIVGSVQCPICQKLVPNKGALNVHLKSHGGQLNKADRSGSARYFCPILSCPKSTAPYRRLSQLKEHYGCTHAPKLFGCSRCDKVFGLESTRKRHQARCGEVLACRCGKSFTSREGLAKHAKKSGHTARRDMPLPTAQTPPPAPTDESFSSRSLPVFTDSLAPHSVVDPTLTTKVPTDHVPHTVNPRGSLEPSAASQVETGAQTQMIGDEFEAGTALVALTPLPVAGPIEDGHSSSKMVAACQTPFEWALNAIESPLPFDAESWAQTDFTFSLSPFSESATQTHAHASHLFLE